MWDDAQVSESWAIDERKGGGEITPCLPFHYLILFIQSQTKNLHFLDDSRRIFLSQLNWKRNTSIQIAVAMLLVNIVFILYTRTVYRQILKFSNKQGFHVPYFREYKTILFFPSPWVPTYTIDTTYLSFLFSKKKIWEKNHVFKQNYEKILKYFSYNHARSF